MRPWQAFRPDDPGIEASRVLSPGSRRPILQNKFVAELIPARFSRTHTAPRPVQPRALLEASTSGIGWRWPRTGATRTPNARRPKPHRSRSGCSGSRGPERRSPYRRSHGQAVAAAQQRWIATVCPPGAMRSKPQTPRAGRWRESGLAELKTTGCLDVATCRGPWVRWTPGVPRALGLFRERFETTTRAESRRENDGACLAV